MRGGSTPSGACTSGSIGHRRDATRPASGSAATTSTATANRSCKRFCKRIGTIAMNSRPAAGLTQDPGREARMGKLVVTEFVSVDGVFEDPGGAEGYEHGGWTFEYDRGEDGDKFKLDELMEADVQLLGRVTYQGFAAALPSREGPFADKLNNDPKYVVSTTLERPEWQNTTVISGDAVEEI